MGEKFQRRLVMIFCLHCNGDLEKLDEEELCLALRISRSELEKTRELFVRKGFIGETWVPKNWRKRQAPSDPTAAERMRRMRAQQAEHLRNDARNVTRNVTAPLRVEGEGEGETEGESPPPPAPSPPENPAARRCIEIATERWGDKNGDSVVGDLLRDYDPAWVKAAIDKEWDKHKHDLRPAYLRSILQGFQRDGGPPKPKHENNGKTAVQQRPEDTVARLERPNLPRTPQFAAIHAMWDELERDQQQKGVAM